MKVHMALFPLLIALLVFLLQADLINGSGESFWARFFRGWTKRMRGFGGQRKRRLGGGNPGSAGIIGPYDLRYNNLDRPQGPPYVLERPGPLSFRLGPIRFRQRLYDGPRNRLRPQEPAKAGPLSFSIAGINFRQIDTTNADMNVCCINPDANCRHLWSCEHPLRNGNV